MELEKILPEFFKDHDEKVNNGWVTPFDKTEKLSIAIFFYWLKLKKLIKED